MKCGCWRGIVVLQTLVVLVSGSLAAQQQEVVGIEGLFAEAWRERNTAARALIAAERIDEAGLMAILTGKADQQLRAGVAESDLHPGWTSAVGLGGRLRTGEDAVLRAPDLGVGAVLDPSRGKERVLVDPRDLCIPWSTLALGFFIAAERRLTIEQCLAAAARQIADESAEIGWNAAAYLLRAGALGEEELRTSATDPECSIRIEDARMELLLRSPDFRAGELRRWEALSGLPEDAELAAMCQLSADELRGLQGLVRIAVQRALADRSTRGPFSRGLQHAARLACRLDPAPIDLLEPALAGSAGRLAIAIVWKLGPRAQALAPRLIAFVQDPGENVPADAIVWAELALGRMELKGDEARAAVAALLQRTRLEPDRRERFGILAALRGLRAGITAECEAWLLERVRSDPFRPAEPTASMRTLRELGLAAQIPFANLRFWSDHGDEEATAQAWLALLEHGEAGIKLLQQATREEPRFVDFSLAVAALEAAPELALQWLQGRDPNPKRAVRDAIVTKPERATALAGQLARLRGDPDQQVRTVAWTVWTATAPADELLGALREASATDAGVTLLTAAHRRKLPSRADAELLLRWFDDPVLGRSAQAALRELDADLYRATLRARAGAEDSSSASRAALLAVLLEFRPLTAQDRQLVEGAVAEPGFAASDDASRLFDRLFHLQHERGWVRTLGERLLGSADPQVRARGADLVWSHRDGR